MNTDEQEDQWREYYQIVGQREPRQLFQELMKLVKAEGRPPGLAIDLGSGDGTESLALLGAGWTVLAVDQSAAAMERLAEAARLAPDRLQTQQASFEEATLPPADLIYSGVSLPFCTPTAFPAAWQKIREALRPGARFAAHFFGPRDSWADKPDMVFHEAEQLHSLLEGLDVEVWREAEDDRPSAFEQMKHYHYFEVIARQPD